MIAHYIKIAMGTLTPVHSGEDTDSSNESAWFSVERVMQTINMGGCQWRGL